MCNIFEWACFRNGVNRVRCPLSDRIIEYSRIFHELKYPDQTAQVRRAFASHITR